MSDTTTESSAALEAARRIVDHQPNKHDWGYTEEVLVVARAFLKQHEALEPFAKIEFTRLDENHGWLNAEVSIADIKRARSALSTEPG
jgi:hypothetical protein